MEKDIKALFKNSGIKKEVIDTLENLKDFPEQTKCGDCGEMVNFFKLIYAYESKTGAVCKDCAKKYD